MHRFRTKSIIIRFRLAALLLCLKYLLPIAALGSFVRSILIDDRELTDLAIILAAAAVVCIALQSFLARRTLCPLCMTPVLANKLCSKHRNAKKLFGSHRLRVAISILAKGRFTCPYCNEPSAMEVRQRNRHGVKYSGD